VTATGLKFGPIGPRALHVAVDMQVLFAEHPDWGSPATLEIAPQVARVAAHAGERTIFTRFRAPPTLSEAPGRWQAFYRHWPQILAASGNEALFDLLPMLKPFAPPALVIDKRGFSSFETPAFAAAVEALAADALVLTGVETDVCVLATTLGAVDRGLRAIVVADAVASASRTGHEAALAAIYTRFDQQVEIAAADEILGEWRR
jgi:nicotinamidase-related amidase